MIMIDGMPLGPRASSRDRYSPGPSRAFERNCRVFARLTSYVLRHSSRPTLTLLLPPQKPCSAESRSGEASDHRSGGGCQSISERQPARDRRCAARKRRRFRRPRCNGRDGIGRACTEQGWRRWRGRGGGGGAAGGGGRGGVSVSSFLLCVIGSASPRCFLNRVRWLVPYVMSCCCGSQCQPCGRPPGATCAVAGEPTMPATRAMSTDALTHHTHPLAFCGLGFS